MNTPNVPAGRLERRVRRMGRETRPGILGFCSLPLFFIRRNTRWGHYCALPRWLGSVEDIKFGDPPVVAG